MIELSQVIGELRRELDLAMSAGAGERMRFELGPVEVEASITVEQSTDAGAKVRIWVVDVHGGGKLAETSAHRIKFTLTPKLDGHTGPPEIAGDAVAGER
ncbi:trypco2 family protein [Streptomyces sp. NPDC051243]|uniref:trypco2 family protein n=1 Tax=Streptomyces sp. NPDC051243 TaxID=3365646 RepID=UPI0037BB7DC4